MLKPQRDFTLFTKEEHTKEFYLNIFKNVRKNSYPSQKLLFPKDIELNNINMEIINEINDFLEKVGFEFQLKNKMKNSLNTSRMSRREPKLCN